jgi:hypothetical protein
MRFFTLALRFEVDGKPCTITASSLTGICSKMHIDRRAVGAVVVPVGLAFVEITGLLAIDALTTAVPFGG